MTPSTQSPAVRVSVDAARPPPVPGSAPGRLVAIAVAPPGAPWVGERLPRSLVRRTRFRSHGAAVEHLRLVRGGELDALPGLDGAGGRGAPSLLRDSVDLALRAGAPGVDVLVVRGPGWYAPCDVAELGALAAPFLDGLHGALVLVPDAGAPGAPILGERSSPAACLGRTLAALRDGLVERGQVALFDLPPDLHRGAEGLDGLVDTDAVLCAWTGGPAALAAHGWRSAAAGLGGALAGQPNALATTGLRVALGEGRAVRFLGAAAPSPSALPTSLRGRVAELELDNTGRAAHVRSEPSLRSPLGAWPLSALRVVKAIHLAILETSRRYVFRRVVETEAFSLALALQATLEPFVRQGVLAGADGAPAPSIDGEVVRDPAAPGLAAVVLGQLRPWCRTVRVHVRVAASGEPTVEVGP